MKQDRRQGNAELLEWYDALIFALTILVVVFVFFLRVVAVHGVSMEPTLQGGDRLIVQSIGYKPQRSDVVVIDGYINYGKPLVKRIIAVGGDVVDIDNATGAVTVNGEVLDEPYINNQTAINGDVTFPCTVPAGCLFVMGDNRQYSSDSRTSSIGFIDERDVLGKVVFRFFPVSQIGGIA